MTKNFNQIVVSECSYYDHNYGCIRTICNDEERKKYKCCIMCSNMECKKYKKCNYFISIVISSYEKTQRSKFYKSQKNREK